MGRMRRRDFLKLAGASSLFGVSRLGCYRLARPAEPDGPLSEAARAFLERAWQGIDPARVVDCHAHLIGLGAGGTGAWVNPRMLQYLRHPVEYMRFSVYRMAAGVEDVEQADGQYLERLLHLVRSQERHGRLMLLAFDQVHREDGTPDPEASEFYTPNDYVLRVAREHPDCFVAAASIHPYRKDAVEELERAVGQGAIAVKWLPNAQRIDPSSPLCDKFYEKLAALGVPLLSHAGEEKAVEADEAQKLGNPLLLRRALEAGVKVIVAHCASLGTNVDLDLGAEAPEVENYQLFLRLVADPRWKERLFGDVSALAQYNRCETLREVLLREELHPRLINGSDYPLPAVNVIIRTGKLLDMGFITEDERALLDEIYAHNPLAFDFALKRTVKVVKDGRELRLPEAVFMLRPGLFPGF